MARHILRVFVICLFSVGFACSDSVPEEQRDNNDNIGVLDGDAMDNTGPPDSLTLPNSASLAVGGGVVESTNYRARIVITVPVQRAGELMRGPVEGTDSVMETEMTTEGGE